jgi:glutamate/tyrosine decarboxylase-like PLP-dependent enzyme
MVSATQNAAEAPSMSDWHTAWAQVEREVEECLSGMGALTVSSPVSPREVRQAVESGFDFGKPVPLPALTTQVIDLLRRYAIHVTHPRYFGLFNPSVPAASVVADALIALYNPQLAAWSHSPAANEIERLTLRYFTQSIGFDPDAAAANFTSGGLEANLSALAVALGHRFPSYRHEGLAAVGSKPTVYVSSESHHSFVKICRVVGLGDDALREVPTTKDFAMDPAALRDLIAADSGTGRHPFFLVGTAGTTGGGIVDPLAGLADVAAEFNLWFHVDAAWGGAALLVPRLRPLLRGIERSDSVTWDAHKWLSVAMGAGMFFCRHGEAARTAFDISTSYMPPESGDTTVDPYRTTLQWSRRAIGLKVFMSLAELGGAGLSGQIEHQARMGDLLKEKLTGAGWIVVNDTALPLVCATHEDIRAGRCAIEDLVKSVQARGRVWISDVVLGRREHVLRACITSFRTQEEDLNVLISELERARNEQQAPRS